MTTKILIVDDSADELALVTFALSAYDTHLYHATSSKGGLALLEKLPDLVILDINLGVGDDGFLFLLERMKTPWMAEIPVIMSSGNGDAARIAKALSLGANGYMIKELDLSMIARQLKKLNIKLVKKV